MSVGICGHSGRVENGIILRDCKNNLHVFFSFFVDILAPQPMWHLQPVGCHQRPIAENLLGRSVAHELALV